jgi:hypothetical protein
MVKVLVFGLKTLLILYLGIVALAFVWVILRSVYNSIKGIKTQGFRRKKGTLKEFLQMVVFIPVVVLWVLHLMIRDVLLTKRWPGRGFKYIRVNDDGTAREVAAGEREYLTQKFDPGDGARPYIKFGYEERTPDGKMSGFLKRRHLPRNIVIEPVEKAKN